MTSACPSTTPPAAFVRRPCIAPSLRALFAYAKLVIATEQGSMTDGMGAIGHQENTFRISEYCSANKTDCVVFNTTTGKFIASQFEDGSDVPKPYTIGAGNGSGTALFFCLMPILEEDTEFQCSFATFKDHMVNGWSDMDGAFECALRLCDNIYRRIESASQVGQAGVKLAVPTTGNIAAISPLALDKGSYAPTGATYGEFKILKVGVSNVVFNSHCESPRLRWKVRTFAAAIDCERGRYGAQAAGLVCHSERGRSCV